MVPAEQHQHSQAKCMGFDQLSYGKEKYILHSLDLHRISNLLQTWRIAGKVEDKRDTELPKEWPFFSCIIAYPLPDTAAVIKKPDSSVRLEIIFSGFKHIKT